MGVVRSEDAMLRDDGAGTWGFTFIEIEECWIGMDASRWPGGSHERIPVNDHR